MTPIDRLTMLLAKAENLVSAMTAELFASKPIAKARTAVSDYETELEEEYQQWAEETAAKLERASDSKREEVLAAALLLLLALLKRKGRESLPDAVEIALDGGDPLGALDDLLDEAIDENDGFLEDSLIPDIKARMKDQLNTPAVVAALAGGTGAALIGELLGGFTQRTGSYSGAFWSLYNKAGGVLADENNSKVKAYLDPAAQHCSDCPQFHDVDGKEYENYAAYLEATDGRVPGQFECSGNCRCWLEFG